METPPATPQLDSGSRKAIEIVSVTRLGMPPAYLKFWIAIGLSLVFAAVCSHVAGIYSPLSNSPVVGTAEDKSKEIESILIYGERAGGLIALASVLFLFSGYFLVRQQNMVTRYIEKNGLRTVLDTDEVVVSSPAIRNCLLIATIIAFISCGTNAVTTALHFWLYAALLLPLLGIAVLFDFSFPAGWQGFSKFNEGNPVFRIILLFTIAGGIGGLGFHVITNEGRVMLPSVGYVGYYVRDPEPPLRGGKDGATALKLETNEYTAVPSKKEETALTNRYVRGNDRKEALTNMRSAEKPYYIGLLDALFSGLLGDVLIGMITANAIHLFVSGLMRYGHEDEGRKTTRERRYFDRQSLTIISLGILAGFCGPRLLPELAENVYKKENKQLREENKELEGEKKAALAPPVDPVANVRAAALDVISKEVWPYVKFSSHSSASTASGTSGPDFEDLRFRTIPEVAVVRAYRRLTNKEATAGPDMLAVMSEAVAAGAASDYPVLMNLLLGEYYSRNKNRDSAIQYFDLAANTENPWMRILALVRRAWVVGEDTNGDLAEAEMKFRSLEITDDLKLPMDLVRITLALLKASTSMAKAEMLGQVQDATVEPAVAEDEAISSTGIGGDAYSPPAEDSDGKDPEIGDEPKTSVQKETAEVVFFASALWDVESWRKAEQQINSLSTSEVAERWSDRREVVKSVMTRATNAEKNPTLADAINNLKSQTLGWADNTATDKINRVKSLLNPTPPPSE